MHFAERKPRLLLKRKKTNTWMKQILKCKWVRPSTKRGAKYHRSLMIQNPFRTEKINYIAYLNFEDFLRDFFFNFNCENASEGKK